mmetsp:Transcript_9833/g.19126  ORF Transcript_9833/g.19126 Transcript_9833/m.19126 type:complete len:212 (+) Transcript_9833:1471-2106(+)
MFFFTPTFPIHSFFQKSLKNDVKFFKRKESKSIENFANTLTMEDKNLNNFNELRNYKNFLPHSFINDYTAPFCLSSMWLQRIGRLDLNKNISYYKNNEINVKNFQLNFKSDPMFRLSKKNKKRKKEKYFSSISMGKNKEEKMVIFDYNTKKKKDTFSSSGSYSKEILKKKENLKFIYHYSFISIQVFKINKFTKFIISLLLFNLSFFIFFF